MNGIELARNETEKDLGILIDTKLQFSRHIAEKVNKANSIAGLIRRSFKSLDKYLFRILFTTVVRPIIEYGSQIWSPMKMSDRIALENVQRRATKMIPGFKHLSYEERLKELDLPTLSYRRARSDMVETFKIIRNHYDDILCQDMYQMREASTTRGHNLKLFQKQGRLEIRRHSFLFRTVPVWNSLPSEVVNAPSAYSFKSRLDKAWQNCELKFNYLANVPGIR